MSEVLRRTKNFFIGPWFYFGVNKRPRTRFGPSRKLQRLIYVIPWPTPFRWYEDPVWHFDRLGLIEIDWLDYTVGIYWKDNN